MFGEWSFWGMHFFWWLFWIALIVVFFALIEPVPRRRRRETPLEVLQRRYAAGEITEKEYEERKARLARAARELLAHEALGEEALNKLRPADRSGEAAAS